MNKLFFFSEIAELQSNILAADESGNDDAKKKSVEKTRMRHPKTSHVLELRDLSKIM